MNNHECEFSEPDVEREVRFRTKGTEYEKLLGDAALVVKVAKAPLDDEFKGVAILANGVWHETTLAGCDRKPFSEYLFGEFDVLALESDISSIPAFDMSRSMKLNPRNEVVSDIIRFIGVNLEGIRRDLERQDRERRKSNEQKQLQDQGSKIADLINSHFKEWSTKLKNTIAKAGVGKDLLSEKDRKDSVPTGIVFGDELPAALVESDLHIPAFPPGPEPEPKPSTPTVEADETAPENLAKPGPRAKNQRPAGGFTVDFHNSGPNEKRAKYNRETRTILINLDHPRVAMEARNASGRSFVDDSHFLRMAYEIAFTEYAIVLAQELSTNDFYFDPQDALVELRQTIDDLSKRFASAWSQ